MTITEFLLARIAEDTMGVVMMPPHPTFADRVIDRKHLLADCEAKRRIVKEADALEEQYAQIGLRMAVRILVAVYADHPDYREEWRV